jgi:amino acid transporter
MTDEKPTRRELLRPLHLLGIALVCGVFAAGVTFVSTGAFTARVNQAIANGSYEGLTPVALGLVIGGGAFIATLLILSMLILAVDPAEYASGVMDRPVLYDEDGDGSETADTDSPSDDPDSSRP